MSHLFCFGFGYSAGYLARRLAAKGWRIGGTATTESHAVVLRLQGYECVVFDGSQPAPAVSRALETATHVLVSAPPGEAGDPVLAQHAGDLARAAALRWIGYLSTVGVYGGRNGGWVDETTQPVPISARSRRRLAAEENWLGFARASGKSVQVFRLAGIYGRGRSVVEDLQHGRARRIVKPGHVFNRIHVVDIAGTLEKAIEVPSHHAVFNVADDEPAESEAVLLYATGLLQLAPPPPIAFADAELSPMARSFYAECKRVSNRRIKTELGVSLRYPTFREGLRAIVAGTS